MREDMGASKAVRVGDRVRVVRELWRYPHFIVREGETGTVVSWDAEVQAVRLDEPKVGAEDWDNEVQWYPANCGEDGIDDLEVLS